MLYRENGQFKTSYRADQQIFPILQDRIVVLLFIAFAVVVVPLLASDYLLRAILIPFVIISLAALGVILMCDTEYGINLTGNELKTCVTVNDIYAIALAKKGR